MKLLGKCIMTLLKAFGFEIRRNKDVAYIAFKRKVSRNIHYMV